MPKKSTASKSSKLTPKQERFCQGCQSEKPLEEFAIVTTKKRGVIYRNRRRTCAKCCNKKTTDKARDARRLNPELAAERSRKKYNKQVESGWRKSFNKEYALQNKSARNAYFINYRKTNPEYRAVCNLRSRLYHFVKGDMKSAPFIDLLGCNAEMLRDHLQRKFTAGMSWGNYGEWHIDHIKPLSLFDLSDPIQQREACNYQNLQPLWAFQNISKGDKYEAIVNT